MTVPNLPSGVLSEGLLGIKTFADVRAFLHVAAPMAASAMVAFDFAQTGPFQMILTAAVALLSPALATANTSSKIRSLLYILILVVGAAAMVWGYLDEATWNKILPIVMLALGSGVAASNTPTSWNKGMETDLVSIGRHAREAYEGRTS